MWLEETVSPRRPPRAARRASRTRRARAGSRRRPSRPCRSGSSRPPTRSAPRRPISTSSTNSSARLLGEAAVEGDDTSSSTPSPAIRSRLIGNGLSSLGVASGWITESGCGSKVSTVSAPRITSRWPRWTPSKVPIATLRGRPGSTSGARVTFMRARTLRRAGAPPRAARRSRSARRRGSAAGGPSAALGRRRCGGRAHGAWLLRRRARARAGSRAPPRAARAAPDRRPRPERPIAVRSSSSQ